MTDAKHLDESLHALRSEIRGLDLSDEEARRRLAELDAHIETRAGKPGDAETHQRLTEQLKESILSFEASHPRLAILMNDALDKLSTMGV